VTESHFIDTNIFLYSISLDESEFGKRDIAIELIDRDSGATSVQVFQEFYVQATRSSKAVPLPHELAVTMIKAWSRFSIQDMNMSVLNKALEIRQRHQFSYWDSAIISAAVALGCRTLYSEDMSHGQQVEGVLIVNPFR
jgi:predicted nucleic acid-binding protein